jgi:hypothetical protein
MNPFESLAKRTDRFSQKVLKCIKEIDLLKLTYFFGSLETINDITVYVLCRMKSKSHVELSENKDVIFFSPSKFTDPTEIYPRAS